MTIDERLEKLVERHEALSHTVELIALEHQKTEKELDRLSREIRAFSRDARSFMRFTKMVLFDHANRLDDLEGTGNGHTQEDEDGDDE